MTIFFYFTSILSNRLKTKRHEYECINEQMPNEWEKESFVKKQKKKKSLASVCMFVNSISELNYSKYLWI